MQNRKLDLILLDFHGVLSDGRFYNSIEKSHPKVFKKIDDVLFSKESWSLMSRWMKGKFTYKDLHKMIADRIGVSDDFLNKAIEDGVKGMKMNDGLLSFSQKIRKKNVKVAIFTDNMDVFDTIFVKENNLNVLFDGIFSSSKYGKLKLDNDALFLSETISAMNSMPENTLFLDDSIKIASYMEAIGGVFYLYKDYDRGNEEFLNWFNNKFPNYAVL